MSWLLPLLRKLTPSLMTEKRCARARTANPAVRACARNECLNTLEGKREEERFCSMTCARADLASRDRSGTRPCARLSCEETVSDYRADYCSAGCRQLQRVETRLAQRAHRRCQNPECNVDISAKHANAAYCSMVCKKAYNAESILASARRSGTKRRLQDPEAHRAANRAWRSSTPEMQAKLARRKVYDAHGMTTEDYDLLAKATGNVCHVCHQAETAKSTSRAKGSDSSAVQRLAVEHDHGRTKDDPLYLRGLACLRCNLRLAVLDNIAWSAAAESYLQTSFVLPDLGDSATAPRRFREFGISSEQYEWMVEQANNCCQICLKPEGAKQNDKVRPLSIDHDHSVEKGAPGSIRGLLCGVCNTRLSVLENTEWRKLAQVYLDRHAQWEKDGMSWRSLLPTENLDTEVNDLSEVLEMDDSLSSTLVE